MPSFSQRSLRKLETCDERLQKLFHEVVKHYDCSIIEGRRDEARQKLLVSRGLSMTLRSKHLGPASGVHAATHFDGQIDEVSVWSAALNATKAAAIYNSGTPTDLTGTANLTNWWRMGDDASDDLTGTTGTIIDQVASLDLTPYNTTSANKLADVPPNP